MGEAGGTVQLTDQVETNNHEELQEGVRCLGRDPPPQIGGISYGRGQLKGRD
jgi:hypothetical protein